MTQRARKVIWTILLIELGACVVIALVMAFGASQYVEYRDGETHVFVLRYRDWSAMLALIGIVGVQLWIVDRNTKPPPFGRFAAVLAMLFSALIVLVVNGFYHSPGSLWPGLITIGPGRGSFGTSSPVMPWQMDARSTALHLDLLYGLAVALSLIIAAQMWLGGLGRLVGWTLCRRTERSRCCSNCGYDLRGNPTTPTCPECGAVNPNATSTGETRG